MGEALLEILLYSVIGDIIGFFGLNTRYFILKIFNKKLKKKDLVNKKRDISGIQHDVYNWVIGCVVFFSLMIGIMYLCYISGIIR